MVGVLGPIVVVAAAEPTSLPSSPQRRLLAVLALHAPAAVRAEQLAELLDVSPSGLRTMVTRLRRALGEESMVVTDAGAYRLTADVDATLFGTALTAPAIQTVSDPDTRLPALEAALAYWRGPAYDEFAHEPWAAGEAARLDELHAAATEDHAAALLDAHRWSDAIAELSAHVARHPLRDRPRGLLMRALAGDGRQAEALRAGREYRRLLAEEVGTEPSAAVRLVERRIAGGWDQTADTGSRVASPPSVGVGLPTPLAIARQAPFVGRAALADELTDSWRTGAWRALIVGGEPGIGKTRLVAELAHRMQADRHVVVARGDEDYPVSYRPWAELLDTVVRSMSPADVDAVGVHLLGALAQVLPALSPHARGTARRPGGDPGAQRTLLGDAVLAVLRVGGPTVLVLDDLQWIDRPSLAILRRVLAAAISDVTVLAAYRDTDIAPGDPLVALLADLRRVDGVRRVALDGIDGSAVVTLVERSTGRGLDAATISLGHAIHARTAGNPLFAVELIDQLVEQRRGAPDERRSDGADVPVSLVEIISRRLARLGEGTVGVLRVAAAVGQRFDVGVVEETVALGHARSSSSGAVTDVLTRLEQARSAGVVADDDDGMAFRHAVIRSALLDPMSAERRRRLHRDIATVLERIWAPSLDRHLEALAYHHDRARSAEAPDWYCRAAMAAADALDAGAADLAERGLELLAWGGEPDAELRCDLLIARALGLRLAGRETIADARRATDAAVALGDPERIAAALLSLSARAIDEEPAVHLAFLTAGLAHLTDTDRTSRWHVAAELSIRTVMVPSGNAADHRRELLDVVEHLDPGDVRS
ncbi:MAG: BTAD domain-containing putative transcriptional regulator, partial [Ilumatobacteraceae bacterium]